METRIIYLAILWVICSITGWLIGDLITRLIDKVVAYIRSRRSCDACDVRGDDDGCHSSDGCGSRSSHRTVMIASFARPFAYILAELDALEDEVDALHDEVADLKHGSGAVDRCD